MSLHASQELRTKGTMLSKAKTEGMAGIYYGLCTTLSTRIRCEVLYMRPKNVSQPKSAVFNLFSDSAWIK